MASKGSGLATATIAGGNAGLSQQSGRLTNALTMFSKCAVESGSCASSTNRLLTWKAYFCIAAHSDLGLHSTLHSRQQGWLAQIVLLRPGGCCDTQQDSVAGLLICAMLLYLSYIMCKAGTACICLLQGCDRSVCKLFWHGQATHSNNNPQQ